MTLTFLLVGCGGSSAESEADASSEDTELTGFGAPREAWNASHEEADGFSPGAVYGSELDDGDYTFTAVDGDPVSLYTQNFRPGTDLEEAQQLVLAEFPSEAAITTIDAAERACRILLIESAAVKEALGANGTAAFFSNPESPETPRLLNPQDVAFAIVTLDFAEGARDLGTC